MKIKPPAVNYLKLRPGNLRSDEFKHLLLLLYWPVFGILFMFVERFYPVAEYYAVYSPIDDLIPFCELFVIPYMFWFVYLVGMHIYTLLYDVESFKRMMKFIMVTYTITIIVYLVWPTCQQLRPEEFARDNFLTRFMAGFYNFDTNTNVCPSIHVIGSLAVMFAALHAPRFSSPGWRAAFIVSALLICASTVFLKQHSIVDVIAAVPVCILGYLCCFVKGRESASA